MRYLRTPNQFQLRLGWLSVIAALINDGRVSRATLEAALSHLASGTKEEAQDAWLTAAGILSSPLGKMSLRAAPEIVRMANVYGIYDPDAQALTDLGQVLRFTTMWTKDVSPFIWKGANRFIGTRVLLGANGDVALAVLRGFPPDGELASGEAPAFLAERLHILAERATVEEDRSNLFLQAERAIDPTFNDRVNRALVFPHLEPLRELGYIDVPHKGIYTLTDTGRRLVAFSPEGSADDLLRHGLALAVLAAAGVSPSTAADAEALRQTLLTLPVSLSGAHAEAALEPVVLLTQARLFAEAPGRWIDVERAAELLGTIERSTAGRIGLKAGSTPDEQNVTWREPAYLDDPKMWTTKASGAPPSTRGAPDVHSYYGGNLLTTEPPMTATMEAVSAKTETGSPLGMEPVVASLTDLSSSGADHVEVNSTPDPLPTAASIQPELPATVVSAHVPVNSHSLLWLSYVERLLAPPILGDIGGLRRGGPVSWLAALRKLLDIPADKLAAKRSSDDLGDPYVESHGAHTIATHSFRRWLARLDGVDRKPELRVFAECSLLWSSKDSSKKAHHDELCGAFLWANANGERLTAVLTEILKTFVTRPETSIHWDSWDLVREATRGIVDDSLHLGLWHAPELLARLGALKDEGRPDAALKLIEELSWHTISREFNFTQRFSVPTALLNVLDELDETDRTFLLDGTKVEMSRSVAAALSDDEALSQDDAPPSEDLLSVTVTLKARTEEQAISRGAEYAAEAVSRLAFLGTLRMPLGNAGGSVLGADPEEGRLIDDHGMLYRPADRREIGMFFDRPEDVGVRQARPMQESLVGVVQKLPALAAIDRGVALDGRARLARSLHWLALADAPHLRPAERLSHGWVAFEHLFADGEQKGHMVAELSAPVVVLCFVRAAAGRLYRDALTALHVAACRDPDVGRLQDLVTRWLGETAWASYAMRGKGPVTPLLQPLKITDDEGLKRLFELRDDHKALAEAVEKHVPVIAWQIRSLGSLLESREKLDGWLALRRQDAMSFLMGIYEVRNQLVHDANPFGFDDAYRLQNLYERYRVTINPVVAEVLRVSGSDSAMPLKHAWALLRARFGELVAQQTGHKNKNKAGKGVLVDAAAFLRCFSFSS